LLVWVCQNIGHCQESPTLFGREWWSRRWWWFCLLSYKKSIDVFVTFQLLVSNTTWSRIGSLRPMTLVVACISILRSSGVVLVAHLLPMSIWKSWLVMRFWPLVVVSHIIMVLVNWDQDGSHLRCQSWVLNCTEQQKGSLIRKTFLQMVI